MRFIGVGLVLLASGGLSLADCRVVRQRIVVKEQVAVITPAVVATFAPVAVAVPTYSASYNPSVDQSQQIQQLLTRIDALEKRLSSTGAVSTPKEETKAAEDKTANIGALFQAKCASCHGADVAATKGAKFALFEANGNVKALNALEVAKIAGKIYTGKMPKNGKMSDEEVAAVLEWVDNVANNTKGVQP